MADFDDDAERHALHEVEPVEQFRWLLDEVDEDLEFFGWQPTSSGANSACAFWCGCL